MDTEPRYERVMIEKHKEVIVTVEALNTINEGLAKLMELIEPNYSYLRSNYKQDFKALEVWIKAHMSTEAFGEEIPEYVIDGLLEVRESARVNMGDQRSVIRLMHALGWDDGAEWLTAHNDRYMDALNEMGKLVQ